jgi:hypothetical protein
VRYPGFRSATGNDTPPAALMPKRRPVMPDDEKPDEFEATMKAMNEAAKLPDDEVEIAADDQGASALAQKLEATRGADDKSDR